MEIWELELYEVDELLIKAQTLKRVFARTPTWSQFEKQAQEMWEYTEEEISYIWDILLAIERH